MRGVTAFLVFLLAACSTAGGDTTTTAPLPEPSTTTAPLAEPSRTTSTAAPTTSTTKATTTTTENECVDRDGDGVLRDRRGFVCPPHMRTFEFPGGQYGAPVMNIYLPGTYTLRQFTPPVEFTRTAQFRSPGEEPNYVAFDYPSIFGTGYQISAHGVHEEMARLPEMQPFKRTPERENPC